MMGSSSCGPALGMRLAVGSLGRDFERDCRRVDRVEAAVRERDLDVHTG